MRITSPTEQRHMSMIIKPMILWMLPMITSIMNIIASDIEHLPTGGNGEIIHHTGYSLQYDDLREQAQWVAYELTREEVINKVAKRQDNFREDPDVDLGSAQLNDYKRSGFDRGHLVPAADLAWSHESMSDSFYLSNMSPQDPSFNRGIWRKLEELVRTWAVNNEVIYVVTGPLYLEDHGAIGASHVDIPSHYYKVIFDGHGDEQKAIALVLANQKSSESLETFVVDIDTVEKLSGLDFFSALEDDVEEVFETSSDASSWTWSTTNYQRFQVYAPTDSNEQVLEGDGSYWISKSSKKRHNSGCRYFRKSKGALGGPNDGVACKHCGG